MTGKDMADERGDLQRAEKHLSMLQGVVRTFFQFEAGIEETLKMSLKSLMDDLMFDSIFVYLYEGSGNTLECVQARSRGKGIIAGESMIPVTDSDNDTISAVFLGKRPFEIWDDGIQICMPLRLADEKIGVLIADKQVSRDKITGEEKEMLSDYAHEISRGIRYIGVFENNSRKIAMLLALSRISEAMATTMEFEPVLEIILKSAVDILKFDMAKLYLVDKKSGQLKGKISSDIRNIVKSIEKESYPLHKGTNRIVDSILGDGPREGQRYSTDELFLYYPLIVKEDRIGVLVVNNVFSRLPISKEDIENLDILANQAAVTLEKAKLYQEVKELSIRDSLTGLYSHGFFLGRFEEEAKRAGREKQVFSLMIIDIDGFKRYNDLYGHQSGDEIILALSKILKQNIRTFDVKGRPMDAIGRYGGDEFVVLLTNSNKDSALAVGNRLRDAVKAQKISAGEKTVTFSVSIGIAIYPNDGGTPQQLFKKADDALYWAKQHGKDQLCLASDIGKNPPKEIL